MRKIDVIITDTHFGVKNNSKKWLTRQLAGLDEIKQYILSIRNDFDEINLVHCGDVFDSRSAINTYVLKFARDKIKELARCVDHCYILAGNHDYYSPDGTHMDINSIELLLDGENIECITKEYLKVGDTCFVPWYEFDRVDEIIELEHPKVIYTHTDLFNYTNKNNVLIISGHIHTPVQYNRSINICSTFALNFADVNQERGFYTLCDNYLEFHPLNEIIKFHSIYSSSESFFEPKEIREFDYLRIYITKEHRLEDRYTEVIRSYQEKCFNVEVVVYSPQNSLNESYLPSVLNIDDIIIELIPDYLKEKFNELKCTTLKS